MTRDLVEPPGGVDPREGVHDGRFSRLNDGEGRGAMVPLQRSVIPACAVKDDTFGLTGNRNRRIWLFIRGLLRRAADSQEP